MTSYDCGPNTVRADLPFTMARAIGKGRMTGQRGATIKAGPEKRPPSMRLAGTRDKGLGSAMIRIRRRPLHVLSAVCLAMALAGCASGRSRELREARNNIYPDNYRADILAGLHSYLSDPTHIRDAYISDPSLQPIGRLNRYAACVRFDARNSDGRYVGSRDVLAVFVAGRFDQFVDDSTQLGPANQANPTTIVKELCGAAEYKRFPELEAASR